MKKFMLAVFVCSIAVAANAQQSPRMASQEVQVGIGLRPILGFTIQQKQPENSIYLPVRFEPNKSPFANLDFRIFSSVPYDYTVTRKVVPGKLYSVTLVIAEK